MLISELIAALGKVNQIAGDIPVKLKHLESGAETEVVSLGIHIDPKAGSVGGTVSLEHPEKPAPATSAPEAGQAPLAP